jgi:predicted phage-related endonuclease
MRRTGISSSEVAGLLGISPFTDPIKIWIEKCAPHLSLQDQGSRGGRMDMGDLMEPVVAKAYCREFRCSAKKYMDTIRHSRLRWMLCTPDYDLDFGGAIIRGLECKNVSAQKTYEWGPNGTDQIPIYYIPQVQQCMAVLDRQDWACGAILAGTEFRHYLINRDEELIGMMLEVMEKFWTDHVVPKKMPTAEQGPTSAFEYLNKRYPKQLSDELVEIEKDHPAFYPMDRIRELNAAEKLVKEEKALMKTALQAQINDGYRLRYGKGKGSMSASWGKGGEGASIDWESIAEELILESEADRAKIIEKHTVKFVKARKFTFTCKGQEEGGEE